MPDWKFDVDDVDENGVVDESIEPGSPSLENSVFVLLGVLAMLSLIVHLVTLLS